MTLNPEITKLVAKWYEYVSSNHHKDRDCHWYIEIDYAYSGKPTYQASHIGYVYSPSEESPKRNRLIKAQEDLLDMIKSAIKEQGSWVNDVLSSPSSWDEDQVKQAKKYNELFNDYI